MLEIVAAVTLVGLLAFFLVDTFRRPRGSNGPAPCQLCKCGVPLTKDEKAQFHVISHAGLAKYAAAVIPCDDLQRSKMPHMFKPRVPGQ